MLTQPGSSKVLGFYTLSSSIIPVGELPEELMKRLPRDGQLPVTLFGRLAVDRSVGGQGVEALLLVDALRRSLEAAQQIAAMAVIVDAKDERAESFYRHSTSSRSSKPRCVCSCPWGGSPICSPTGFPS